MSPDPFPRGGMGLEMGLRLMINLMLCFRDSILFPRMMTADTFRGQEKFEHTVFLRY